METGLWLISSDVTGEFENKIAFGPTAIISPKGEVIKQLPLMEPGLLICTRIIIFYGSKTQKLSVNSLGYLNSYDLGAFLNKRGLVCPKH